MHNVVELMCVLEGLAFFMDPSFFVKYPNRVFWFFGGEGDPRRTCHTNCEDSWYTLTIYKPTNEYMSSSPSKMYSKYLVVCPVTLPKHFLQVSSMGGSNGVPIS